MRSSIGFVWGKGVREMSGLAKLLKWCFRESFKMVFLCRFLYAIPHKTGTVHLSPLAIFTSFQFYYTQSLKCNNSIIVTLFAVDRCIVSSLDMLSQATVVNYPHTWSGNPS